MRVWIRARVSADCLRNHPVEVVRAVVTDVVDDLNHAPIVAERLQPVNGETHSGRAENRPRAANTRLAFRAVVLPTPFLPASRVTRPRRGIESWSIPRNPLDIGAR